MSNKYLTIREASIFLNMKNSRIRYEIFKKRIPYYKIGKSIRFDQAELVIWVLNHKHGAKNAN